MTDILESCVAASAEQHYHAIRDEIASLHRRKGGDYGKVEDPFANLRAAESFGIPAWVGVALRLQDKMSRIQAFVRNGRLENESLEDSLLDIANYGMLALALYRESLNLPVPPAGRASIPPDTG